MGKCHREVGPQNKTFQEKPFECGLFRNNRNKRFSEMSTTISLLRNDGYIWLEQAVDMSAPSPITALSLTTEDSIITT